jgi:phage protein D
MAQQDGTRVGRPSFVLGGEGESDLAERLLQMLVVEDTAGLYRCEALFGNWGTSDGGVGFLFFDRKKLDFGKAFQVKHGDDTLFDGRIMGLEAHFPEGDKPQLCVLAEDRFQDLRMTRRTRTFTDADDASVFRQISGHHGLSADVDLTGPTHKMLAQVNQSDLAFLRERARAIDAELWMEGNKFRAQSRSRRNGGTAKLTRDADLREFTVLADLAGQRTSVFANGWDVVGKSALQYEATASVLGGELNGDTSGASILESTVGTRKEALAHTLPLTSEETRVQAEAFFKMTARRFVTGRGVAESSGKLRVGNFVDLQGLGPLFSGKYYVTEVRIRFDGVKGIRTEFLAERPGLSHA